MLWSALLLILFRKFGGSNYFEQHLRPDAWASHPLLGLYGDFYWFCACFLMLGLVPLLLSMPRPFRPASLGLGAGDWRFGLKWVLILYAVMAPVVVVASRFSTFSQYYPLNGMIGEQAAKLWAGQAATITHALAYFLVYELLYGLYFVGWEFFYRGFMTFGLEERLGPHGVLVANIPFALMHVGKPFPEALGSIVAGVALGLFALRARSFWPCVALHVGVAWTMDVCAIERKAAVLSAAAGG